MKPILNPLKIEKPRSSRADKKDQKIFIKNKKALFDHEIIQEYTAGIQLKGYEVKAIKEGKVNFEGSYVQPLQNDLYVINLNIGSYSKQSKEVSEYEAKRSRRLLLNRSEIEKIKTELSQKGRTTVPLAFVTYNNMVKLELAVVKGRKIFEKKNLEKERQIKRDLERESKEVSWLV